jgi:Holliday junction resolvase-like predicted endonuclease
VEVKTRSNRDHAEPQDAVNPRKQEHLMRAARTFIQSTRSQGRAFRFDIVTIEATGRWSRRIEHFVDAFSTARPMT